jgi:uncharacterized membrane protein
LLLVTSPASRTAAQQRADAIALFQDELRRLESEGVLVLTGEQRAALDGHHAALLDTYRRQFDIDRDAKSRQLSAGMRIASFLGALALSASVYFLFYQFWGALGTTVQVLTLVAAAIGSFAATTWVHRRDSSGYFTNLAATVALACFVLDLTMLGQIFNVRPADTALLAWGALALVLAYGCDLRLQLVAGIALLFGFVGSRMATWSGAHWFQFGDRPEHFFIPAAMVFFIPRFVDHDRRPAFPPVYRAFGVGAALLTMFVLAHWGRSYLPFDEDTVEALYQWLGFVAAAAVAWLGVRRGWTETVNVGVGFFVIFLFTKLFDWWWETMPKYLFFLVLGLTAVAILLVLRRLRRTPATVSGEGR